MRPLLSWIVLLGILCVVSHAQTKDARLMSEAEYKAFLNAVDAKLPEWRAAFQRVDPAKTDLPYAVGHNVVLYRDIALRQIESAANAIQQERVKHRVSRELWLHGFLQGIYDSMDALVVYDPSVELPVEKISAELGPFIGKIANDSHARVELLEKGTCP
jgi:hypothetical protein